MSAVLYGLKYGQHEMATGYLIAVKRFVDSSATGISGGNQASVQAH